LIRSAFDFFKRKIRPINLALGNLVYVHVNTFQVEPVHEAGGAIRTLNHRTTTIWTIADAEALDTVGEVRLFELPGSRIA
jgi:hypothetical protein